MPSGIAVGEAFVTIRPDTRGFAGEVETGVTSPLKKALGTVAAGAVGYKVGQFFRGAFDEASALNETVSKSNTIFGGSAGAIRRWADGAVNDFGQTRQQALEAASSFGNMFSQLGIGEKPAMKMSKRMTELASDFASFHNADITEVIVAQQAAFRGEYDALQRFVPTINAAAVEQRALAMTGKESTKELTAGEKAAAAYALMMEGAGAAVGDFDKTSDSAANQQRKFEAGMADLKATIGQALIPVFQKMMKIIIPIVQWLQKHRTVAIALATVIGGAVVAAFAAWAISAATAAAATLAAAAPVLAIIAAVALLATGIFLLVKNWDKVWNKIKQIVSDVVNGLIDFLKDLPGMIWDAIKGISTWVWDNILKYHPLVLLYNAVVEWAPKLVDFLAGVPGQIWEALKGLAGWVWDNIVKYHPLILLYDKAVEFLPTLISFFTELPGKIVEAMGNVGETVAGAIMGPVKAAWNAFVDFWNGVEISVPGVKIPFAPDIPGFTVGLPDLQKLHQGGIFRAPNGQREGLALLRDGERVLTPGEAMARAQGGDTYNVTIVAPERDPGRLGIATARRLRAEMFLAGR